VVHQFRDAVGGLPVVCEDLQPTEAEFELAGQLGIMSIPTLMVFRDQILLYSEAGALPSPALEDLIRQVKDLDIDDIRRRIEEEEARAAS